MKRTLILSLALLTPVTAVKAIEPATVIALSGPIAYALTNDCFDAPSSITNRALMSVALAATAKLCANEIVTIAQQPASDANLLKLVLLCPASVIAGILACGGTEGCIREFLRNTNQKK